MKLLQAFWRYWKFVCIAFTTTFVVLFLLAVLINFLKPVLAPDKHRAEQCLESGGTWDDIEDICKTAA